MKILTVTAGHQAAMTAARPGSPVGLAGLNWPQTGGHGLAGRLEVRGRDSEHVLYRGRALTVEKRLY